MNAKRLLLTAGTLLALSGCNSEPLPQAATPTFSPATGTYISAQAVTLSTATAGAAIHFTTDGSTPTASSPTYTTPISVGTSMTVKAIATAGGYADSPVGSAAYVLVPPLAPKALKAVPENSQVTLDWSASEGATGYHVYYSTTAPVSTASPRVAASGTSTPVTGLTNGAAYYFAATATGPGGESQLSDPGCGVPTPASTTGLTLYDPLCGPVLDGQLWQPPGSYYAHVFGGAASLSAGMGNEESQTIRNSQYTSAAVVNAGAHRVTTLQVGQLKVPSAAASRSGGGEIRASVRLLYSPPASRLNFPGGNKDFLLAEVGLVDMGAGMQAYRMVVHCDVPSCATFSIKNITFQDPPGFASLTGGVLSGAPAAYDQNYTFMISLDEATGVFHWLVGGGTFGAGVSGTADPSAYLAGTPGWSGVPLAGSGYFNGQVVVRTLDLTPAGGGSGAITAEFTQVQVGLDGAPASHWDDFSGTSGNSAPPELRLDRWTGGGTHAVGLSDGALVVAAQSTSVGTVSSQGFGVSLGTPESVNTVQADITMKGFTATGAGTNANAMVQGRYFNDGTSGGSPNSALGDILAGVLLSPVTDTATYSIMRCTNPQCGGVSVIGSGTFSGVSVGTGLHTVLVKWDPTAHTFTFGVDGSLLVVDPSPLVPVAGPPNSPMKRIFSAVGVPATQGTVASTDVRVNNVFVAR